MRSTKIGKIEIQVARFILLSAIYEMVTDAADKLLLQRAITDSELISDGSLNRGLIEPAKVSDEFHKEFDGDESPEIKQVFELLDELQVMYEQDDTIYVDLEN